MTSPELLQREKSEEKSEEKSKSREKSKTCGKSKTESKSTTSTNSMCSPFSTTPTLSPSSSTYICIVPPHTSAASLSHPLKQPPPKRTISPRPLSLCFGPDPVANKGDTTRSALFPPVGSIPLVICRYCTECC